MIGPCGDNREASASFDIEPEEAEETNGSLIIAVGVCVSLIVATYAIFILGHNGALTVTYGLLMALAGGWLRGKGKGIKETITGLRR